jgi:tRNA pseudouridine32 synthase / 23S rRNA pseudouridine746 synthase
MTPDDLLARVLHRDGLMLVIDKPAGIPVHAGPKGGANLEQYLDALRFGLPERPALAHRLDKDTSGCLVLGRHRRATADLGALFASGRIAKTYWAVVAGGPPEPEGVIDAALAKKGDDRRSWWMKVDAAGQPSLTRWRVLGNSAGVSFVELSPETGRTHQLRVHMAHLGCPIVGDAIYGGDRARGIDRSLHLHARRIVVPLRKNKPPVDVTAPAPRHMRALLSLCGFTEEPPSPTPPASSQEQTR